MLDIKKALKDIMIRLNLINDYVVETGTSGIWTYRKWNSGIAECWGRWTGTLTHYVGPYGTNFYGYTTGKINLPFTFSGLPSSFTYNGNIGDTFTMPAQGKLSMSTSYVTCYFIVTGNGSKSVSAELSVKGLWKQLGG